MPPPYSDLIVKMVSASFEWLKPKQAWCYQGSVCYTYTHLIFKVVSISGVIEPEQEVCFHSLGRYHIPIHTSLSKWCRNVPSDWIQDNTSGQIYSGNVFSLYTPHCQSGVGLKPRQQIWSDLLGKCILPIHTSLSKWFWNVPSDWNQDNKPGQIYSGSVFSLYTPHCQSGVGMSRVIETKTTDLVRFTQEMYSPYTDLIVKVVSEYPEWLNQLSNMVRSTREMHSPLRTQLLKWCRNVLSDWTRQQIWSDPLRKCILLIHK